MKTFILSSRWLRSSLTTLAVASSITLAFSQEPFVLSRFNSAADLAVATAGDGDPKIIDWSSEDADGNAESGSLECIVEWANVPNSWHDSKINFPDPVAWPGLTVTPYVNVEFDVKVVAGGSTPATDGSYGYVQVVCQGWNGAGNNTDAQGWVPLGIFPIPAAAASEWQHISAPLTAFATHNLNQLVLNFAGNPPGATIGTIDYLVDNIVLTVPSGPAPELTLEPPPPAGLNLFTSTDAYARQNIRTVGSSFAWVDAGQPVTYSVTIAAYPSSTYNNFQTHMLLVPGAPAAGDSTPDWNAANVVRFDIGNNSDGTAYGALRYKTNAPGSNGIYYDAGNLGNVGSTTVVGTWSVTFNDNVNITLRSPDGTTTPVTFPADAVANFRSADFRVYFGAMPNNANNIGQRVVISHADVMGAGGGVSDDFSAASLDPAKWEVSAALPANVVTVPTNAKYWLSWTLPDNQFSLRATFDLTDPNGWIDPMLPAAIFGGKRRVIIPEGMPSADVGFFQLIKQP